MLNDPNLRTTFVPLLLRLTLAAIFIYHGLMKITPRNNDWGSAWATDLQLQSTQHSAESLAMLKGHRTHLDEQLRTLKEKGDKLADGDEKTANAEEQQRLAQSLANTEKRIGEAESAYAGTAIKDAKGNYARSSDLPAGLSYTAIQLAVAWGELLCGVALLFGLFTRLASVGVILIMLGAIYTMTQAHIFTQVTGAGFEYNLALAVMAVVLIIKGAGPLSLDEWLESRRKAARQQPQPPPPQPVAV
jgi:uncharacterized membrane protein YphA (DoxX/SURF4 family)